MDIFIFIILMAFLLVICLYFVNDIDLQSTRSSLRILDLVDKYKDDNKKIPDVNSGFKSAFLTAQQYRPKCESVSYIKGLYLGLVLVLIAILSFVIISETLRKADFWISMTGVIYILYSVTISNKFKKKISELEKEIESAEILTYK